MKVKSKTLKIDGKLKKAKNEKKKDSHLSSISGKFSSDRDFS
jgi:hypothetical protein